MKGQAITESVLEAIEQERQGLIDLALNLSGLNDVAGYERPVAEAVTSWFKEAGVHSFVQPISPTSANAVAVLEGTGEGPSLILSSHMDTEGVFPSEDPEVTKQIRGATQEGELLVGKRIGNNKGQLVAQMIATRALHEAGDSLKGDVIFAATAQETAVPQADPAPNTYGPVRDEYLRSGPHYGEGFGARWLVDRGVVGNYALVGESTGFALQTAQAGVLRVRFGIRGLVTYTPLLHRGEGRADNPNPFEKAAYLVQALESWARTYEVEEARELDGGLMVPKAQIHEIRTSGPLYTALQDSCYIYLDVRLAPERDPVEIISQLRTVARETGLEPEIAPYDYTRGFEAAAADVLVDGVKDAHRQIFGEEVQPPAPPLFSMFTDSNRFNEAGIPSATYGAPLQMENFAAEGYPEDQTTIAMKIDDLLLLAKVYALSAVNVCGVAA